MKNHTSRKYILGVITAMAFAASALHAQAQNSTITFDLTTLQNNAASSTITGSDGVTTLTVATTGDWGSNSNAIFVDDTNGLMAITDSTTSATLSLSFNRDANFKSFNINTAIPDFGGSTTLIVLDENSDNPVMMSLGSISTGSNDFSSGIQGIDAIANSIWFFGEIGNPARAPLYWNSLSVTTAPVPEPATYALFLGFGAFVFIMIRHRRRD